MYDAYFNLNSMQILNQTCMDTEEKLKNSIRGQFELSVSVIEEIDTFAKEGIIAATEIEKTIAAIGNMIIDVENKKASAISKIKSEISSPTPPNISTPSGVKEQLSIIEAYQNELVRINNENQKIRENNSKIDCYVKKCDATISKLREILDKLKQIESLQKEAVLNASTEAKEQLYGIKDIESSFSDVGEAMKKFSVCYYQTIEDAEAIVLMRQTKIKPDYYAQRQFEIKRPDKLTSELSSSVSAAQHELPQGRHNDTFVTATAEDTELLITAQFADSFFKELQNFGSVRIPAVNFHKLGGKSFAEKMKEKGYCLKSSVDGRIIDDNGMIHWEKEND